MADTPYKGSPVPDWVTKAYPVHTPIAVLKMQHDKGTDHTYRAIADSRIAAELHKIMDGNNPKKLPRKIVSVLVSADICAKCLGELDTGWECNECGFDWKPWMDASTALNDAAHYRREG